MVHSFPSWLHCKPKPCKAHRELSVSIFPHGKPFFHYREPLLSLKGPCFHYRDFPVSPSNSLLGIAVCSIFFMDSMKSKVSILVKSQGNQNSDANSESTFYPKMFGAHLTAKPSQYEKCEKRDSILI